MEAAAVAGAVEVAEGEVCKRRRSRRMRWRARGVGGASEGASFKEVVTEAMEVALGQGGPREGGGSGDGGGCEGVCKRRRWRWRKRKVAEMEGAG